MDNVKRLTELGSHGRNSTGWKLSFMGAKEGAEDRRLIIFQ